jgi:non-homologous end joining protein Ku
MRDHIGKEAQRSGRSMKAEIVARLEASFQSFLSREGLVAVSKRLEGAAAAFENLFMGLRDKRADDNSERTAFPAAWKGIIRLSLVTCPVELIPATTAGTTRRDGVTRGDLDSSIPGPTQAIEIDEFVPRGEIDARYMIRPYYLRPYGKVDHEAFAVIRETIRETNKVAIGRVLFSDRQQLIALDPLGKGLLGTLLRYPYEVQSERKYFDEIQHIEVSRDMLELSKHIVEQMSGHFEPGNLEGVLMEKSGPLSSDETGSNVINLMDALKKSAAKDKTKKRIAGTKK